MGGSTRIEYELDDTKNYFPVLYTENGYDIQYEGITIKKFIFK